MNRTDVGTDTSEEGSPCGVRVKVLHIDDSPEFVEMAATFLQKNNDSFDVVSVTDPTEVPPILEEDDFDCVVSDCGMPDMAMDGIELHSEVRSEHPDIPYIFFTGTSRSEFPDEAVSDEATAHMEKEIDPRQFSNLASRITGIAKKGR